jgi:hypothetical protein
MVDLAARQHLFQNVIVIIKDNSVTMYGTK